MKRIRDLGNGYSEQDTAPLTDAERAALDRRQALEPPDAGRKKPGAPDFHRGAAPDTMRAVGLDGAVDWLPNMPTRELEDLITRLRNLLDQPMTEIQQQNVLTLLDAALDESIQRARRTR